MTKIIRTKDLAFVLDLDTLIHLHVYNPNITDYSRVIETTYGQVCVRYPNAKILDLSAYYPDDGGFHMFINVERG